MYEFKSEKTNCPGGTYLEWIAVSIFWHLRDDSAAITKLAHLATSPSVKTSLLICMTAVIL